MAKISPASIKYSIIAEFSAEGPFEKTDVIGAIFGQTEGLLGPDMELRELQKEGKIGRIEVELQTSGGKTTGEIIIPSALDKAETTIIAAAIETIDKIGPTDAKITIKSIEDIRGSKREYIMQRAKQLLSQIKNEGMDSVEIENELRESTRISRAIEYGPEMLTAGPDIETSNEIIVVEGRADVLNLLRNGIKNVIGMQGTKLPKTIIELSKTKELTLFIDGDRGGKLIAQNVCDNARVSYIAQAPDGKEVEELTGKEILQALRKKMPANEFISKVLSKGPYDSFEEKKEKEEITEEDIQKLRSLLTEIKGKNIYIINENLNIVDILPLSKIKKARYKNIFILASTNATSLLIKLAESLNAKAVAAKTFSRIPETKIKLISI